MNTRIRIVLGLAVAVCLDAGAATKLESEMAAFDARVTAELRAADPAAADLFEQAGAARNAGHWQRAAELYRQVHERAPGFVHATRRLCGALVRLGQKGEAIPLCREAVEADSSAPNLAALADALLLSPDGKSPPPADDVKQAHDLALRARRADPDDYFASEVLLQSLAMSGDMDSAENVLEQMERSYPDEPGTSYWRYLVSMARGQTERARAALERARPAMSPEQYRAALDRLEASRSWNARLARPVAWVVGLWLAGLAILTVAGWILSHLTLRAAATMPPTPEGSAQGASLRRLYRGVLAACCVYYYVSLPLVILAVVVAGGEAIYGMLVLGHVPFKLIFIVGAAVVVTVFAALRSLFVRTKDEDPGTRVDLDRHPAMRRILDEVADKIGTRAVSNVYMTPGTDIAVMERGGLTRRIAGQAERCLILGAGVLEGMGLTPFKAVLAHEYGHFSNRDTAGGGLAIAVHRSIFAMAANMARGGAATWYNPAWWFLRGFHRLFLLISQGASRLQEVLADRWAAFSYGARAFEDGLRHVIERSVRFPDHVDATFKEVVASGTGTLPNLYAYRPRAVTDAKHLDTAVEQALNREPSVFDSHPSPVDRFRWVQALDASKAASPAGEADAWSLFADRAEIEQTMTAIVRHNFHGQSGINLRG